MKNRILSTLLVLCMVMMLLPGIALAEDSGFIIENGVLTKYSGFGGDVTIPDNVTQIGDYAFTYKFFSPTSITIPNSVTSIGTGAFATCDRLTSITIPSSIRSLSDAAFEGCSSLGSITIPNSVTSIGLGTFSYCRNLTSITVPNSVTSIGSSAFSYCSSLTSITIPNSVTTIESGAFDRCSSLTSVTIPNSVTAIDDFMFYDCSSLTNVTIPNSVTSIGHCAFDGCTSLTRITIPDHATSIGADAFNYCTALTDVYYSGTKAQWDAISIGPGNDPLTNATIHWGSESPNPISRVRDDRDEYIYGSADSSADLELPVEQLDGVEAPVSAAKAVSYLIDAMTSEQKKSPINIDLAALYAETAVAKAASMDVTGSEIIVSAESVSEVGTVAAQAAERAEDALTDGGINMARYLSKTVTLRTDETDISILVSPDVLSSSVDKVRVETPSYALVFKLSDLAPDLTQSLTFTARLSGEVSAASGTGVVQSLSASDAEYQTIVKSILANAAAIAVEVGMGNGRTSNSVTICLPVNDGDKTYQTVASTDGTATASKYNPATGVMEGKINASGTYTVKTNQKDFSDIANKSAEMQKAIRYLASKGIISGTTATTFSPDGSINRAEIATLLVKTLGKLDSTATASFSDVTKGNWFYTAAASSQRHKLINGYEDNTFRGTTNISKVQIVAVSSRVLKTEMGYKEPASPAAYLSKYSDTIDSWAQSEVALATKENLIVYRTDGTFSGDKNMTRGDAAIIIYRLFQRIW